MTYLITFACYGCHLHGEERGSVDRKNNKYRNPLVPIDETRSSKELARMAQSVYVLEATQRAIVSKAIQEVCTHRSWWLLASHVRMTHLHVVVDAEQSPEKLMNAFKVWASRKLNEAEGAPSDKRRWARHGSTRWLWKEESVNAAVKYVIEEQGERMEVHQEPGR